MDEPLKALDELGAQFERIAHRDAARQPGRRPGGLRRGRVLALALPGLLVAAAVAVAATGILTGAPVRNAPGTSFKATTGVGKPGRAKLLALRVVDPDGGPPWGMSTVTTTRGFACIQVGRVVDGRLGVLGQDGAFGDDGRFHELPGDVLTLAHCLQPDAAGHLFIGVTGRSVPASALDRGCAVAQPPPLPKAFADRLGSHRAPTLPTCAAADVRILDFGLLGPRATSVTYENDDATVVKTHVDRPEGAYLIVRRPSARRPVTLGFSVGTSPGRGIRSVGYDGAPRCVITSGRRIGGARGCPLVGFVRARPEHITAAQIATPVRATFAARRVRPAPPPPGVKVARVWRLTISFRARHGGDARSNYVISIRPRRHSGCDYMTIAPLVHDVRRGAVVREPIDLPGTCHGVIVGTVAFRPQSRLAGQQPLVPDMRGAVVAGRFEARIPG